MTIIDVTIKGTRNLLMNSAKTILIPKNKKVKSSERDPIEDAKLCLHLDENGKIAVPSIAILSAMRRAATNLKKAGSGKKTLKDYVFSGLQINPMMVVLSPQEYTVDIQVVTVQRARVPRARPLFKNWSLNFRIAIVDEQTWDAGTVRQVLEEAGKFQGLLDFRPLYGTFEVVSMKVEGKEVK
jgi:hypothetical protein